MTGLPGKVAPMLATHGPIPEGDGWAYEFKWDGVPVITAVAGGDLRVQSRNDTPLADTDPELATETGQQITVCHLCRAPRSGTRSSTGCLGDHARGVTCRRMDQPIAPSSWHLESLDSYVHQGDSRTRTGFGPSAACAA
jgi:hypothetical protein